MPLHLNNNSLIIADNGEIDASTSVWWHCHYIDASKMRPAGGPVETNPDGSTLGGWQLDAATEYLYSNAGVCNDWDGATDLEMCVFFEVNVDNSGGGTGDTVDLQLITWYKALSATAVRTQTTEEPITVGQSPQYKLWNCTFTIDWDYESNVVLANDIISFRLNLETDTSEVDNIIVNHMCFRYKTAKVRLEVA